MVSLRDNPVDDLFHMIEILAIVAFVMIGISAVMIGYAYPNLDPASYVFGIAAGIVVWEEMKRILGGQIEKNTEEGNFESPFELDRQ